MFDFDTPVERRGSDSIKWARYAGQDVIPMWVADMDFAAPPPVLQAMRERIAHGVFGYAAPWPTVVDAVRDHLQQEYDWRIDPEWIVWIPGVVAALNVACRCTGSAGDGVFTSTPVYPPFLSSPGLSSRRLVTSPLLEGARWEFDFTAIDGMLGQTKLWLLCHPHNPVGRAWDAEELREVARLAQHHDVVVCSDEIHCGLVLDDARRHLPFARLSEDAAQRSITLMAPSKTFNIPGLYSAFAVIPNAQLRRNFMTVMAGVMPHINTLGLVATEAAYRDCADWHDELLAYLRGNARCVEQSIGAMPGLKMAPVEATYLAWIDCRDLCAARGIGNAQGFFEAAGVGLSNGADFGLGTDYAGFVRLNFGCPHSTLDAGLHRMAAAIDGRR